MLELMKSLQGLQTMLKTYEKMDIPDQLPEKRKKRVKRLSEQAKDEGIDLTPQQKFGNENECLENV